MKLTTKGRYAVTAMMDLALHARIDCVTLTEIADRQRISLSYLEQLFSSLRKAGLVSSARGPKGGYRLAREDKDISIGRHTDCRRRTNRYDLRWWYQLPTAKIPV